MKVTVIQFEGTPEELDASDVLRRVVDPAPGSVRTVVRSEGGEALPDDRVPGVADEGQEAVRQLLESSPAPQLFIEFLAKTTSWEKVMLHGIKRKGAQPGAPLDYSRYLRLRKQGSPFGGFAYVYPGFSTINLRLNCTDEQLKSMGILTARTLTTGHQEYRVSVDLAPGSEQSLADALTLADLAYNAT